MARPDYIFIGGCYRTGTDLLRNVLNCSDEVAICGETHYFGNPRTGASLIRNLLGRSPAGEPPAAETMLWKEVACAGSRQEFARVGDLKSDEGIRKIVAHIYGLKRSFWRWLQEHVERDEFERQVLSSERSEKALFDLLLRLYAGDKPVRGEKTPAHIHSVPTLLEWFPNARIVHMFRDPRAIFASQKKKKSAEENVTARHRLMRRTRFTYEIYVSLNIITHWLRVVQLHHDYRRRYPGNYYLLRFEDLVTAPEESLRKLCDFLEVKPTEKMLERRVVNSSFVGRGTLIQGFDPSAIDRWRQLLHPATKKWFAWACRKHLAEFGYQD